MKKSRRTNKKGKKEKTEWSIKNWKSIKVLKSWLFVSYPFLQNFSKGIYELFVFRPGGGKLLRLPARGSVLPSLCSSQRRYCCRRSNCPPGWVCTKINYGILSSTKFLTKMLTFLFFYWSKFRVSSDKILVILQIIAVFAKIMNIFET